MDLRTVVCLHCDTLLNVLQNPHTFEHPTSSYTDSKPHSDLSSLV